MAVLSVVAGDQRLIQNGGRELIELVRAEGGAMTEMRCHEIRKDQCAAAESIRLRFGIGDAFDYAVGEKLMNFAEAAEDHPECAQALPQFVSELRRRMFTPEEIEAHLARVESARLQRAMDAMDVYDPELDDLAASEAEARRFECVKEWLTAPALGTS